jgi:sarcosine oxidase subunit gamma
MADLSAPLLSIPGLAITEEALRISILRVRDVDKAATGLGEAFAAPWPTTPNTITKASPAVAWLAPGEWAIFECAEGVKDRVQAACQGLTHHLADLSAGRRRWRIEGAHARTLIAKGCSLDTDPRAFGPGQCAQTLLDQVFVLIISRAEPHGAQVFDIVADASLAGHLRAWLADAALEFRP